MTSNQLVNKIITREHYSKEVLKEDKHPHRILLEEMHLIKYLQNQNSITQALRIQKQSL